MVSVTVVVDGAGVSISVCVCVRVRVRVTVTLTVPPTPTLAEPEAEPPWWWWDVDVAGGVYTLREVVDTAVEVSSQGRGAATLKARRPERMAARETRSCILDLSWS